MYLNNSRCSTAEDCLRKYFLSYEFRGFGIKGHRLDENLAFGSLIHYALAQLYAGRDPGASCTAAKIEWEREYNFDDLPFDEKNEWLEHFAWAERIIREYAKFIETADDFEVLQIETEGSVQLGEICYSCGKEYQPLMPACIFCGAEVHNYVFRADLAVAKQGGIYVIDHKTTKSTSDNYLTSWHYSPQLYGYAYGYGKALGTDVSGYGVNIIRKLKTVGLEDASLKQCPDCRGGSRKRLSCTLCNGRGKVERAQKPSDRAFLREWEPFDQQKAEHFVRMRLRTAESICTERDRFSAEPDAAWPMNPQNCFKMGRCPFVKLCWEGDASRWWEPDGDMLESYEEKTEDYVSMREMVREDMR